MSSTMYLPWLRTGMAVYLPAPGAGARPADATLALKVALSDNGTVQPEHKHEVTLRGPGHVVALDPQSVIREEPPRQARAIMPTTFPHVELREPDLPWRHTPVGADAKGRIPPWIVLVCARVQDGVHVATDSRTRRPVLHVQGSLVSSELPDLREAWAWAHVQVSGLKDGEDPLEHHAKHPAHAIARLVCPRRLLPFSRYVCAVVPAYQAGVEAARGDVPTTKDLTLAWSHDGGKDVALPTLHSWSFTTGEGEGFEDLVKRLAMRSAPTNLGERPLQVLPLALGDADEPVVGDLFVPLRGALRAPPAEATPMGGAPIRPQREASRVPPAGRARPVETTQVGGAPIRPQREALGRDVPVEKATPVAVANKLAGLWTVQAGTGDEDPVVLPPKYGSGAALKPGLPWLAQLNHHPAHRTAAGLGAEVVMRHQEELVAATWDQLEQARSATVVLRQAQLAAEIGRTQARRIAALPAGDMLQLTARTHTRILDAKGTLVRARLIADGLPEGALVPRMRRLMRPGAPATRRRVVPVGTVGAKSRSGTRAGAFAAQILAAPVLMQRAAAWVRPHGLGRAEVPASSPTLATRETEAFTLQLRPLAAHVDRLRARLTGTTAMTFDAQDGLPDALRLMPRFDVPLSRWLVDIDPELILPGLGDVPDDTVMVLETNRPFVEAVLAGANDALARELAWREFPVDPCGSAFHVFWDGADGFDTRPLRDWKGALGSHTATEEPNNVGSAVLLRGALLRRYPGLRIYLGKPTPAGTVEIALPTGFGRLAGDTSYALFAETPQALLEWWLVLEEVPGSTRFGLDSPDEKLVGPPQYAHELSWTHFGDVAHAPAARPGTWGANLNQWGRDSGALASLTLQRPIRYALQLSKLLAPGDA